MAAPSWKWSGFGRQQRYAEFRAPRKPDIRAITRVTVKAIHRGKDLMHPLRSEHITEAERSVRVIEAQRYGFVDVGRLRRAALGNGTADVHDHCDDALCDEPWTVPANRDRHAVRREQRMCRSTVRRLSHGRRHDRAPFHHRKKRIHGNSAPWIEILLDRACRGVVSNWRDQYQRINARSCTGLNRRAELLEKRGKRFIALLVRTTRPDARGLVRRWRRFRRNDRFHLCVVLVETFLGLAPQHSGLIARSHDEIGPIARLLE